MGRSSEFDRDGDPSPKKVVTGTGPLGLLPVMIILVALMVIIVLVFWWWGS